MLHRPQVCSDMVTLELRTIEASDAALRFPCQSFERCKVRCPLNFNLLISTYEACVPFQLREDYGLYRLP